MAGAIEKCQLSWRKQKLAGAIQMNDLRMPKRTYKYDLVELNRYICNIYRRKCHKWYKQACIYQKKPLAHINKIGWRKPTHFAGAYKKIACASQNECARNFAGAIQLKFYRRMPNRFAGAI
jgi:hypothetical protein